MNIYVYVNIYIYMCTSIRICGYSYSCILPTAMPTHADARASDCLHVCVRTHRRCHRAQPARAASTTRRTRSSAVARRPAEKAAHTLSILVTDAMFHRPMDTASRFALKFHAWLNACEPNRTPSTAGGKALAFFGADAGVGQTTLMQTTLTRTRAT